MPFVKNITKYFTFFFELRNSTNCSQWKNFKIIFMKILLLYSVLLEVVDFHEILQLGFQQLQVTSTHLKGVFKYSKIMTNARAAVYSRWH